MDYISIDNFEGPLDLLLHLIKESNIDIFDISIEEITNKYMDYIKYQEECDINVSSSYLVMASELLYLKSKSLLPKNEKEEENEEEITRENLIDRLLEYKRYKEVTSTFKELEEQRKKIYIKSPESINEYSEDNLSNVYSANDLLEAFSKFLERKEKEKPLETKVTNREYSVRERKSSIRKILKSRGKTTLDELFEEYNKAYIVVTFMSVLEMVKENDLNVYQNHNFDKIVLELRN